MNGSVLGKIGETHNFKVTTFIRAVLWSFKGATKMRVGIVDELKVDVRRLVIITDLVCTADQTGATREEARHMTHQQLA